MSMDKHALDDLDAKMDVDLSTRLGKDDILKLENSMRSLVVEMKVMNQQLQIMTGDEIKEEDLEERVK